MNNRKPKKDRFITIKSKPGGINYDSNIVQIPLVPVPLPIFPQFFQVIQIEHEELSGLICRNFESRENLNIGCFANRWGSNTFVSNLNQVYHYGTIAEINSIQNYNGSKIEIIVTGKKRIRFTDQFLHLHNVSLHKKCREPMAGIDNYLNKKPVHMELGLGLTKSKEESTILLADVIDINIEYDPRDYDVCQAYAIEISNSVEELFNTPIPKLKVNFDKNVSGALNLNDFILIADAAVSLIRYRPGHLQDVLQIRNVKTRLEVVLNFIKQELEISQIHQAILKKANNNIQQMGRRHVLMEQIKVIQNEIGDMTGDKANASPRKTPVDKYKKRLESLIIPDNVKASIDEEISKLEYNDPNSSEYSCILNYLDIVTSIPWGIIKPECFDIEKSKKILDEDHYGIKDVKNTIIEYLAVKIQSKSSKGKILCFAGPPGVGKTSVVKSIAKAMDREYARLSVGGMDDVCEIKGHRKTYIGALAGKIVNSLRAVKSMNPVILLDEIDKTGRGVKGDPAAALLEALDPEQNHSFVDYFVDLPIDLSNVFFVCTANDISRISRPLLDRMEIIMISSYTNEEKVKIAENYIVPTTIKEFHINTEKVHVNQEVIEKLVSDYCREPGVRNLKKHIEKIYRKATVKVLADENITVNVDINNLTDYVGFPLFQDDVMFKIPPIGVVPGLAFTEMGGRVLYIETFIIPSSNNQKSGENSGILITGSLGDVMKESCQIALSVAGHVLNTIKPGNDFFQKNKIHIHFPDGAAPKDGPSAGITIVSALLSLALDKPVLPNYAMTGEICLSRMVLPVGGLKEKLIAAIRSGIANIIVPEKNRNEIKEIPESIVSKVNIIYADNYIDVFNHVFPVV